jgi:hypothetical protein
MDSEIVRTLMKQQQQQLGKYGRSEEENDEQKGKQNNRK